MSLRISLKPGDNLYKYQLIRFIGGGNFGEVWLALDVTLSREVAVKILDESMAPAAENLREAQLGHRLQHQNVVHVHYADVVPVSGINIVIIAMDYHPNGSVLNLQNPSNFLVITQALAISIDILRGLEYLHEQGLFHNDIKPSNILIGPRREGILTDYGISGVSPNLQPTPAPNAYVLHRAPETAQHNNISVLTDIYQVGLTLFRLINGLGLIKETRDAIGQDSFEQLKAKNKVLATRDYRPFVPNSIRKVISKATKADPTQRFQSVLEMRRALENIALYGHWTTDSTGNYQGYFSNQLFYFTYEKNSRGFKFTPYRRRLATGNETRIARLCASNLSENGLSQAVSDFMLSVINGNI
ncbi:Serine/threonine protein kinase [Amphritea atlantica]|uniref:Serine/threonine protein kinase n=1 Tax=Amphritea atlantica TaxID=355243 RepID=A0A1H9MAX6_9GAMM|nr:serine/threonine-protein kinase [Amphritea atlantica]SER20595.1 Serine/threonine protein kinase [Amphritea atlantica]